MTSEPTNVAHLQQPHKQRMSEMADAFPALRNAPGIFPFEPRKLAAWSRKASHGENCAARFVLGVWTGKGMFPGVKAFNFFEAMGVWDKDNRAAFLAWCKEPYWP